MGCGSPDSSLWISVRLAKAGATGGNGSYGFGVEGFMMV
jgi:hypothetical protein